MSHSVKAKRVRLPRKLPHLHDCLAMGLGVLYSNGLSERNAVLADKDILLLVRAYLFNPGCLD